MSRFKFILYVISVVLVIILVFLYKAEYTTEYIYLGHIDYRETRIQNEKLVDIITNYDELNNYTLNLKKFKINLDKYNILVSYERKIEKILFRKKHLFLKSHFIKVYLDEKTDNPKAYVYITPKESMYFDERFNDNVIKAE